MLVSCREWPKAARCRWWARGAPSACDVFSGDVCVAGRKREAGDAIVENRVGAAQARVGFELCAMDLIPIAKNIAQMAALNSKIPKTLETLETLETLKGLSAWSVTSLFKNGQGGRPLFPSA